MPDVPGFGPMEAAIFEIRQAGQSFTCKERRAAVTIINDCENAAYFVRLDHGFFKDGASCDYSGSTTVGNEVQGFLLELKGSHEKDAFRQLENTLERLCANASVTVHYHTAILVPSGASLMPSAQFQKHQRHFLKQRHVRLCRLSNGSRKKISVLL